MVLAVLNDYLSISGTSFKFSTSFKAAVLKTSLYVYYLNIGTFTVCILLQSLLDNRLLKV